MSCMDIGPQYELVPYDFLIVRITGQSPFALPLRKSTISASVMRPEASMISGVPAASDGAHQSVHSWGTAKLPRSAWSMLKVATPERRRTFRTANRCPRSG